MPEAPAFVRLDAMLTMADYGVFCKYAGMGMLPSYTVEPGATARELKVTDHPPQDMHRAIAAVLDRPAITVLTAVQDVHSASPRAVGRRLRRARGCRRGWWWPTSGTSPATPTCRTTASR